MTDRRLVHVTLALVLLLVLPKSVNGANGCPEGTEFVRWQRTPTSTGVLIQPVCQCLKGVIQPGELCRQESLVAIDTLIQRERTAILAYGKILQGLSENIDDFIALDARARQEVRRRAAGWVVSGILGGAIKGSEHLAQLARTQHFEAVERMVNHLVYLGENASATRITRQTAAEALTRMHMHRILKGVAENTQRLFALWEYGHDFQHDDSNWQRFWNTALVGLKVFNPDPVVHVLIAEGEFLSAAILANVATRMSRENLQQLAERPAAELERLNGHIVRLKDLTAQRRGLQGEK